MFLRQEKSSLTALLNASSVDIKNYNQNRIFTSDRWYKKLHIALVTVTLPIIHILKLYDTM